MPRFVLVLEDDGLLFQVGNEDGGGLGGLGRVCIDPVVLGPVLEVRLGRGWVLGAVEEGKLDGRAHLLSPDFGVGELGKVGSGMLG